MVAPVFERQRQVELCTRYQRPDLPPHPQVPTHTACCGHSDSGGLHIRRDTDTLRKDMRADRRMQAVLTVTIAHNENCAQRQGTVLQQRW